MKQYLKSLDYFISEATRKKVDVALSNHTAIDNVLECIMYSKVRLDYMPNINIIVQDEFQNYCQVFRTLSYEMLEKLKYLLLKPNSSLKHRIIQK